MNEIPDDSPAIEMTLLLNVIKLSPKPLPAALIKQALIMILGMLITIIGIFDDIRGKKN